jgi:hypothetical protein
MTESRLLSVMVAPIRRLRLQTVNLASAAEVDLVNIRLLDRSSSSQMHDPQLLFFKGAWDCDSLIWKLGRARRGASANPAQAHWYASRVRGETLRMNCLSRDFR